MKFLKFKIRQRVILWLINDSFKRSKRLDIEAVLKTYEKGYMRGPGSRKRRERLSKLLIKEIF